MINYNIEADISMFLKYIWHPVTFKETWYQQSASV